MAAPSFFPYWHIVLAYPRARQWLRPKRKHGESCSERRVLQRLGAAGNGDDAAPHPLDLAERPHPLDEGVDLIRRPRHGQAEGFYRRLLYGGSADPGHGQAPPPP